MIRRLLAAASVLSLLLCVATAVTLYISCNSSLTISTWGTGLQTHHLVVFRGEARIERCPPPPVPFRTEAQFVWIPMHSVSVTPYAILAIFAFSILPVMRLRMQWTLYRRMLRNECLTCGYDLRASTGRCSECGTPIPAKVKA